MRRPRHWGGRQQCRAYAAPGNELFPLANRHIISASCQTRQGWQKICLIFLNATSRKLVVKQLLAWLFRSAVCPREELPVISSPGRFTRPAWVAARFYKELDFDVTFVSDEEFVENTLESAEEDHKPL